MKLSCRSYPGGDAGCAPLVLLHGLFGSAAQWHHIAAPLSARTRVLAVDLRNHGLSPHTDAMDYESMAEDLRELLDAQGIARARIAGHSMGGKVAMAFALRHPRRTEALAVLDIAPARYHDPFSALVCAALRLDLAAAHSRQDADRQLERFVPSARLRAMLLQNLAWRDGRLAWRIHWLGIGGSLPQLLDFPAALQRVPSAVDALFVRGDASDYVLPRHEDAIHALFLRARIEDLADAGHWLHADQPAALVQLLAEWLERPAAAPFSPASTGWPQRPAAAPLRP
ncbi:alpha/beta fold hydrolase [Paenacidovorax monticola]|uniref:Alpha/beta fold hydrolase n=1 Tax=Paenacidovorax monticola TaxID=1926868 RepID=A0A7H0HIZ8_9BURK|nr:alpha/beta fold hydrolase [Paenacidovorax monticola]QNP60514.1 alpha/beta fold hydrolase [Paenacidovorax monticola]